jgi:cell division septum initiation protein DivIVA
MVYTILIVFLDMTSCEIKSEDFFQEFMDLEEFIDASTASVASPGSIPSPFDTSTSSSCQILDGQTSVSINEQQSLQEQQMANNSAVGVQVLPNLDHLCQENVTSSTADTGDKLNTTGTLDCNSSLGNGVIKDRRYWDRRIKNNIAAKRSRDAKRLKETTVVKRWTFLEEENKHLKEQIKNMKRRLNAANGIDQCNDLPIN